MSELISLAVESESLKGRTCGRICDEHAREAKTYPVLATAYKGALPRVHRDRVPFYTLLRRWGDFADFFRLPDGLISIYLGDVVGKGLPAAMYSALVMGTLRGIHKTGTDTADVLARLNERLVQRPIRGRFCSTLYALFSPATRELFFSNAGMPLPLLASSTTSRLGEGGFPSGMFPGAAYERHVVQLGHGDCVLFASDGLHELRNGEGVELCAAQMKEVWAQCRHKSATESLDFRRRLPAGLLRRRSPAR